ncbi:MAG: hypothetical protein J7L61_01940, partial [Thermoplasmata archaeon]|nr:hypothetical protein [Thermoplasmata archaeon]
MLKEIAERMSSHPRSLLIFVIVTSIVLSAAASNISFETEEDSFNPQNDVALANREVGEKFGMESEMAQILVVQEGGNALTPEILKGSVMMEWALENDSTISPLLDTNTPFSVYGPADMIYTGAKLLGSLDDNTEALESMDENLSQMNLSVISDSFALPLSQAEAAMVLANSTGDPVLLNATRDLYGITPRLMASSADGPGGGGQSNQSSMNMPMFSSLSSIVSASWDNTTTLYPVKGAAANMTANI